MKRARADDGNFSKARFEVGEKKRFKKRFANQFPYNTPRVNKGSVRTPKPQEGIGSDYYIEKSILTKSGRKHEGK